MNDPESTQGMAQSTEEIANAGAGNEPRAQLLADPELQTIRGQWKDSSDQCLPLSMDIHNPGVTPLALPAQTECPDTVSAKAPSSTAPFMPSGHVDSRSTRQSPKHISSIGISCFVQVLCSASSRSRRLSPTA